ncbi:hypothetical protein LTR10_021611 [Elasticomyces elasticus]|uniref:Uncharacterized protein n=1 Tax=Exophiala sideris TaxID=1016849 RepID=A0ABR0J2P5_9EURO|nr:hypothetical protein LTR10_021611 [Elasticomyces elasticus]KAK5024145.1 hypothetical protein LTS07_008880 [Exophiala sideris]KAK5028995.1 hypothetical protein LTR13_008865 [Exophiala sideris]KAK5054857.1 hypothetical protein LTR69_008765 [Exophiala sideris]KAK5178818.1 hypothetical protein LTR44_008646 [Eurotiomycetes sp. CCFEE 6388]
MGLKRKASSLDEPVYVYHGHPHTSPTAPSLTSSPSMSTSTISPTNGIAYPSWNISAVPYLTSRTRKRYRDDRPEVEIIHENTLRKLYDAQRLHLDEALPMSEVIAFEEQEQDDPGSQKTIESFFGGRSTTSRDNRAIIDGAHPHTGPAKRLQKHNYHCSDEMIDDSRPERTDYWSRLGWT